MEPLLLGLSTGLVCLASCGAAVVPWLVLQQRSVAATGRLLASLLAGRFVGYLLFAVFAWAFGALVAPSNLQLRAIVFGLAHLALAGLLTGYAVAARRPRHGAGPGAGHPSGHLRLLLQPRLRRSAFGPLVLGLLTGLNVCPPFIAATVRAAELRSLPQAIVFFAVMFLGTSVWFLPLLAAGAARRLPQSAVAARAATALVAVYYAYTGALTLYGSLLYG